MKNISLSQLAREPLVHFLVISVLLIGGERLINSDSYSDSNYSILVDDKVLSQYLQQQAKTFRADQAEKVLAEMSEDQYQILVDDYVRGEVLYREALELNLDRDDPIIRRRLIQKMDYLAQGFYDQLEKITEADLKEFFQERKEDYREPASATFTHIFISSQDNSLSKDKSEALALLSVINEDKVPFENAGRYGDRFLYNRNYVNRDSQEIASHFGRSFGQQLFSLEAVNSNSERLWQGPLRSDYGWHLVLVTKLSESRIPSLSEISRIVLADAQREQQAKVKRLAIDKLREKYRLDLRVRDN
jgi:hypothetical protein